MEVLLLIDSLRQGGAERSALDLVGPLDVRGISVTIATLERRSDLSADPALETIVVGTDTSAVRNLRTLLRSGRYDLLHTALIRSTRMGQVAALGTGRPVVTSLVNTTYAPEHVATVPHPSRLRAHQALDILMAPLTRRFHAISEAVADAAVRYRRIPRERIVVIPRGRDRSWLDAREPERRAAARTALGVPDDALLVLNVARHEPQKGQRVLLEAMGVVRRRLRQPVRLVVAGREGTETAELRRLATAVGNATILGFQADVRPLLAAADIFVFPSYYEGLGGAVIEAMAAGLPVVASDIPALREVTGGHAQLVRPGDAEALAEGIVGVANEPARAQALADAGRVRFQQRYSLDAVADAMARFYEETLSGPTA